MSLLYTGGPLYIQMKPCHVGAYKLRGHFPTSNCSLLLIEKGLDVPDYATGIFLACAVHTQNV